jgi:myosin-crossreactive antigen
MVESFLRKSVVKNWNEADTNPSRDEVSLGNSGYTMADIRQYLMSEVFIALRNYDPEKKTKESTFVYGHLSKRVGSLMKKLVKDSKGYGVWMSNIEQILGEIDREE